jgi:hypothetical protein
MNLTKQTGTTPALATQASRARLLIAVMLFVTVVINYMDRANLSIAIPAIADEMDLSKAQQGLLLSAFGWTYAAPTAAGRLARRPGPSATALSGMPGALVGRHDVHGHHWWLRGTHCPAPTRRRVRGPRVPHQQQSCDRMVPRARARIRDRVLHLRPVHRPGIAHPGAVLAPGGDVVALGIHRDRCHRCRVGSGLVRPLSRAQGLTSQ